MEGENQKPKWEWTQFKNRTGGNKNFKPTETEERTVQNKSDKCYQTLFSLLFLCPFFDPTSTLSL